MRSIPALLAALLLSIPLHAQEAEDEFRTWTSSSGSTIVAKLVEVEGDTVRLLKKDTGKVGAVEIAKLSDVDQTLIAEFAAFSEVVDKHKADFKRINDAIAVFKSDIDWIATSDFTSAQKAVARKEARATLQNSHTGRTVTLFGILEDVRTNGQVKFSVITTMDGGKFRTRSSGYLGFIKIGLPSGLVLELSRGDVIQIHCELGLPVPNKSLAKWDFMYEMDSEFPHFGFSIESSLLVRQPFAGLVRQFIDEPR